MFDFEDDFVLESSRIPWIIWIQILVLLLLMLLLYCFFSIFSLDPSTDTSRSSASSSISHEPHFKKPVSNHDNTTAAVATDCFQQAAQNTNLCNGSWQGGANQSIKGDIATGTRRRVVRGEDNVEREGPSSKDACPISFHPCHYFRLAKIAFLKCLGLDPSNF